MMRLVDHSAIDYDGGYNGDSLCFDDVASWSDPNGAAAGVEGKGLEVVLEEGQDDVADGCVKVVVADGCVKVIGGGGGSGCRLWCQSRYPKSSLGELGADEAQMIKDPQVNAQHVVGQHY
ncbi:hypothetical protein NL676_022876 [Syzygium grande]|nr:hypothetical protein NL676_022876 [Syzygium grande]